MKILSLLRTCTIILAAGASIPETASLAFATDNAPAPGKLQFVGQLYQPEPSSQFQNKGLLEFKPQSSIEAPETIGQFAHTHVRFMVTPNSTELKPFSNDDAKTNFQNLLNSLDHAAPATSATTATVVNTPSSIACVYQLVAQPSKQPAGCNPAYTTVNPSGGGGAIAIVDAYDYPTAAADLAHFSSYFGLPAATFQTIYAGGKSPYISGSRPPANSGWELEEALDIEWAHAMAPHAKIFLVEAPSNSFSGLFTAILAAEYMVSQNGGGEISMSWGSSEFSGETSYDTYFSSGVPSNVVFLASAGDVGSVVSYPAVSPYVIGLGGTTIFRNSGDNFTIETSWTSGGGGISSYEARPAFQGATAVKNIVGTHRGTPDISLDANPSSGVAVYISGSWYLVGGTSVSSPTMAGIMNAADYAAHSFPSATTEITRLYTNGTNASDFRDINSGGCGGHNSATGFDLCTGWGSAITYTGK